MSFRSRLRKRWSHSARRRSRAARFRPIAEALEDRAMLSALTVVTNADSGPGSLRAELAAAQDGDTIRFAHSLAGQTITLTSGQLAVGKSVGIEGPGAAALTVSGGDHSRVFDVEGAHVTIAGLTIAHGLVHDEGGGGIAVELGAKLDLLNDTVADNTAYGIGGGVWNAIGGTLSVSGSTFVDNRAIGSLTFIYPDEDFAGGDGTTEGGGIDNDGTGVIRDSAFTGNLAQGVTGVDGTGGGAKGGGLIADGPLTVVGSTFIGNVARAGDGVAGGDGGQAQSGALEVDGADNVANVSRSVFVNNQALGGDGGDGAGGDGGDGGIGAGGAMSLGDGTLTVANCSFTGNTATGGTGGAGDTGYDGGAGGIGRGGAYVHTVTFGSAHPVSNISNVVMSGNQAVGGTGGVGGDGGNGGMGGDGRGGGIRALLGAIAVDHSLLSGNEARGGAGGAAGAGGSGGDGGSGMGGGFLTEFGVEAVLSDTALLFNLAQGGAGGAGIGGGIFNGGPLGPFPASDLTLLRCLVAFNDAQGGAAGAGGDDGQGIGGGLYSDGGNFDELATAILLNRASTSNDIYG